MQELLHATDLCASAIRQLHAHGVKAELLEEYISPHNARALENTSFTRSVMVATLSDSDLPEHSSPHHSPVLHMAHTSSSPAPDSEFINELFCTLPPSSAIRWEPARGLDPELAELAAQARARTNMERRDLEERLEGHGWGDLIPLPRQRKELRKPSYGTR